MLCRLILKKIKSSDYCKTIYAFQDPSIEAEKSLFASIEDMAACYLIHIQKIQKKGPYYLCGASFGSLVVAEIAYLLEQQQQSVNFIGLLDGWGIQSQSDFDVDYVRQIIHLHHQDEHEHKQFDKQSIWEHLLQQRLNMMLQYQYKKLQSPLILFKAQELLPEYERIDAPDNHWSQYTPTPLSVFHSPGDHHTMLQTPNVETLARQFKDYLDAVSENAKMSIDAHTEYGDNQC